MSFSSNRRDALDDEMPLAHRASHARSCALHVAQKFGVAREDVISRVTQIAGVSLHQPTSAEELERAMSALDGLRGLSAW